MKRGIKDSEAGKSVSIVELFILCFKVAIFIMNLIFWKAAKFIFPKVNKHNVTAVFCGRNSVRNISMQAGTRLFE